MEKRIFALVIVAIFLMAGVGIVQSGFQTAVTESQPQQTITNESWTVDEGNVTELSESNRDVVYNASVSVYNSSGVLVAADGNYTWFEHNGTVKALSGSPALDDGKTAEITYHYTEPTNEQQLTRDTMLLPTNVLSGAVVEILGFALLLGAVMVFANSRRY